MCSIFIGPLFFGEPRPWPSGPEMSPFTRARASVSQQRPWVRVVGMGKVCVSCIFLLQEAVSVWTHYFRELESV